MSFSIKAIGSAVLAGCMALTIPSAAFALTPEVVNDTTFTATQTTVTATLGDTGGFNASSDSPLFFSTDGSGGISTAWVKWTFSSPVSDVRIYYGHVESVLYGNNSGNNDPQKWSSNLGGVNFADVSSGGNKVASAGDVVTGQPEASLSGSVANCVAPNIACSGYVDLHFPAGVTWIKTQNAPGGAGPGFNAVGLAVDAGQPNITDTAQLSNTGFDSRLAWLALGSLMVGTGMLVGRRLIR